MTEQDEPRAAFEPVADDAERPAADSSVIYGAALNGSRPNISFPFYSGPAGMAPDQSRGIKVAYFGVAPRPRHLPADGTIDGEAYRCIAAQPSRTAEKMAVLTVVKIEG